MKNKEKQIKEMRRLADEMGKAISTEYEKRCLADERKLEAVLKANGWCKASEVVEEVLGWLEEKGFLNIEVLAIKEVKSELKKKYTEDT